MSILKALAITLCAPLPVLAETVFDTGEDRYAEDGPWIAVPADYTDAPLTPEDIVALADLDGDPSVVTADEQAMINVLTQVLIPRP